MAKGFAAQITAWVAETKERQEAVFRESAQRVVEQMQRVGPSVANPGGGEGGAMPVATGFLRASLVLALGSPAPAIREPPAGEARYNYDASQPAIVLAGASITDKVYATYTANYAVYANYRNQFVGFAADQWPRIVAEVCQEASERAR